MGFIFICPITGKNGVVFFVFFKKSIKSFIDFMWLSKQSRAAAADRRADPGHSMNVLKGDMCYTASGHPK